MFLFAYFYIFIIYGKILIYKFKFNILKGNISFMSPTFYKNFDLVQFFYSIYISNILKAFQSYSFNRGHLNYKRKKANVEVVNLVFHLVCALFVKSFNLILGFSFTLKFLLL